MKDNPDKELQRIQRKTSILKRIFIISIIISIIGLCGFVAIMVRTNQLQEELDNLDREMDEKPFSELTEEYLQEHEQRVDEINRELDWIWIYFLISGSLLFGGTLISITVFNHRKNFLKLIETYENKL
jgi:hypothetical protein